MNKTSVLDKINLITNKIESFSELIGRAVSWCVMLMVLLVGYDVTMRYLFKSGSIALQELEWHLFSIIFLLGAAYTFKYDDHVRLDLVYHSHYMDEHRRVWVNLIGNLLFLIPFCLLIIHASWPFVSQSFIHTEGSPDPGGLPYRWLLKACIPLGFILLMIQGIGDSLKNLAKILSRRSG